MRRILYLFLVFAALGFAIESSAQPVRILNLDQGTVDGHHQLPMWSNSLVGSVPLHSLRARDAGGNLFFSQARSVCEGANSYWDGEKCAICDGFGQVMNDTESDCICDLARNFEPTGNNSGCQCRFGHRINAATQTCEEVFCNAGHFRAIDGQTCTPCPAGQFQPLANFTNTSCSICGEEAPDLGVNQFWQDQTGQARCKSIPNFSALNDPTGATDFSCWPGFAKNSPVQDACTCVNGNFIFNNTECRTCPTYAVQSSCNQGNNSHTRPDCLPNFEWDNETATCYCPAGRWLKIEGSTYQCLECPEWATCGATRNSTSFDCFSNAWNTGRSTAGNGSCSCPGGAAPSGRYIDGTNACVVCPANADCAGPDGRDFECRTSQFYFRSNGACQLCNENFRFWNGTSCVDCPAGQLSNSNRLSCMACAASDNLWWDTANNSCANCPTCPNCALPNAVACHTSVNNGVGFNTTFANMCPSGFPFNNNPNNPICVQAGGSTSCAAIPEADCTGVGTWLQGGRCNCGMGGFFLFNGNLVCGDPGGGVSCNSSSIPIDYGELTCGAGCFRTNNTCQLCWHGTYCPDGIRQEIGCGDACAGSGKIAPNDPITAIFNTTTQMCELPEDTLICPTGQVPFNGTCVPAGTCPAQITQADCLNPSIVLPTGAAAQAHGGNCWCYDTGGFWVDPTGQLRCGCGQDYDGNRAACYVGGWTRCNESLSNQDWSIPLGSGGGNPNACPTSVSGGTGCSAIGGTAWGSCHCGTETGCIFWNPATQMIQCQHSGTSPTNQPTNCASVSAPGSGLVNCNSWQIPITW